MTKFKYVLFFLLLLCISFQLTAQNEIAGLSESEIESYKDKAKDQVKFLEYLLNTLGDANTSPRDKDAIVLESYKKVFRDSKVQVEDDLTENRLVLINKDVTAYLKDIDFFFQNASFDFDIQKIEAFERDKGQLSLRIELLRTLKASGLEGESILNTKTRYIETNLDQNTDELQIASIYTTKVSRDKALQQWWNTLSIGWQDIFRTKFNYTDDSLSLAQINEIVAVDTLDLSDQRLITTIEPLSILIDLKALDLSNTLVEDISPLSSLTGLRSLALEGAPVGDLNYLRYAENIEALNIAYTRINDLSALQNLQSLNDFNLQGTEILDFELLNDFIKLKKLDLSETRFNDISEISELPNLEELNLAKTNVTTLTGLSGSELRFLDISFTGISDLTPIKYFEKLQVLSINNTQIRQVAALNEIPRLQKVYADNMLVSEDLMNEFKRDNPDILLITNSEALSAWWFALPPVWKQALTPYINNKSANTLPTKEELTQLIGVDSLSFASISLEQLFPLKKFSRLNKLTLTNVGINSLEPLRGLNTLTYLNASSNKIQSANALLQLKKLKYVDLSENDLSGQDVLRLSLLKSLEKLNVNGASLTRQEVKLFLDGNDNCILRYDDDFVNNWWQQLNGKWKQVMRVQKTFSLEPDSWELHDLLAIQAIVIIDEEIDNLTPLKAFASINSLFLERVDLIDENSLSTLKSLSELTIRQMPFYKSDIIAELDGLISLTLDFSAVEDLRPFERLMQLENLSLIGTRVDKLKGLSEIYSLKYLNISSTPVKKLKRLDELTELERLVCYNTRIKERRVDDFRSIHPECEVFWY